MVPRFPGQLVATLSLVLALSAGAVTHNNDDSCDIAMLPAATLLLPYFEVDLDDGSQTTLLTITNVTNADAVARVTLWTDRGYPVFSFNVFLTGYDVQPLNLYDILGRGVIAHDAAPRGEFSDPNPTIGFCDVVPRITEEALARIQGALTDGRLLDDTCHVGEVHENAAGYATVDVVGNCDYNTPADSEYWLADLRFDNILTGDYQQIDSVQSTAQGGALVHIRAIPEGRPSLRARFERTFYARYTTVDARQPLPAQFAARWTSDTSLKIWREARAGIEASCDDYADASFVVADVVVFDEQENAIGREGRIELFAASKTSAGDERFPQLTNGASSGWMYLNLDRSRRDDFASQAWVISSTRNDVDAIAIANGCAAPVETRATITPQNGDDSCDIALLPAATLLLPHFEVDIDDPHGETTTFTVTNVSAEDRIARVTLWTDYAFPVITFNIFLTGYDVQSIDLYDVIVRGVIGERAAKRGPLSHRNFALDRSECHGLGGPLPAELVARMQSGFTERAIADLGDEPGCNNVGLEHENAVGYATIDVVRNCEANGPISLEYWTEDLLWDNVLIGDYQQVHATDDLAQSSTLVHIRAIDAELPRTFYSRLQPPNAPRLDRRQPLPSVFAARWFGQRNAAIETHFTIWREGQTGRDATCSTWHENVPAITEIVRYDEQENVVGAEVEPPRLTPPCDPGGCKPFPATMRLPADKVAPSQAGNAGWMYWNLDHDAPWASQNWVIVSMRSGPYSVDFDAAALGNGCSPPADISEVTAGTSVIGPRP